MSPFCGLGSLKQSLKNVHIISTRGFALTRIKLALFLLQNIIFWVPPRRDWHGPGCEEWNGALGPASHKCHPHPPLLTLPSLAPTHPGTWASVQLRHSHRRCLFSWIQPGATCWDVFRGYRDHWSIFQPRSLCFNFPWSYCLLLLFSLHLSSVGASVLQVFPPAWRTWLSNRPSHGLYQH